MNVSMIHGWLHGVPYHPEKPAILSAFLGKITRNLAIDCFRRKKAAKRSTEHILELCKELEEIEDVTAYSLNDEIQRKEILEILEKFLGIPEKR